MKTTKEFEKTRSETGACLGQKNKNEGGSSRVSGSRRRAPESGSMCCSGGQCYWVLRGTCIVQCAFLCVSARVWKCLHLSRSVLSADNIRNTRYEDDSIFASRFYQPPDIPAILWFENFKPLRKLNWLQ